MASQKIGKLHTEQRNPATIGISELGTAEILQKINEEDQSVALKVREAIPAIERAVELIVPRMRRGGRMVYVGAGTSGRLGYMDAAECGPTYGMPQDAVSCVMAGGHEAVFCAQESLEDQTTLAAKDLEKWGLRSEDIVIAAAASGRTPYCIGALTYAQSIGAGAVSIACNPQAEMSSHAQVAIEVDTGSEVIMGSTRMKAGTAQKMVMNMLSTTVMVRLGRTCDNLMVCLKAKNEKIVNRAARLFMEATGEGDPARAQTFLQAAEGRLDVAILMYKTASSFEAASQAMDAQRDFRQALRVLSEK